jgi:hypothetical protein
MALNGTQRGCIIIGFASPVIVGWLLIFIFSYNRGSYDQNPAEPYFKSAQEMVERQKKEQAGKLPTPSKEEEERNLRDEEYKWKFATWKRDTLSNTAVTEISSMDRISIFVRLTPDKYKSISGAQNIARDLASSYCRATGVRRAHCAIMLNSDQFAAAWGE